MNGTVSAFTGGVTGNSNPTLRKVGNYIVWLCGEFGVQAQTLTGGGTVTPIIPPTNMPNPLDFIVDNTSPIPTGGTTVSLPSFVGFNVVFVRGGFTQSSVNTEPSFYSWNKVTGQFTCYPAAAATELFSINPV